MKTSLLRAALAAQCLIASAPLLAASFDCSRAGSANEKAICGDVELSSLDDRLGKAFRQARQHAPDRRAFTADSDKQWRWREQNCHDRACLLDWYRRRTVELESQAQGSIAPAAALPASKPLAADRAAPDQGGIIKVSARATAVPAARLPAIAATAAPADALAQVTPAAPVSRPVKTTPAAAAATAPTPVPAVTMAPAEARSLRLNLSASQVAGIAPAGTAPWPHYVRADKNEYFYEDVQPGAKAELVGVRYYGIENGQYIIEASRGNAVWRYTCSADCAYIGQLTLPGDIEKDMVIVRNDSNSLPSVILNDAIHGLLTESRSR